MADGEILGFLGPNGSGKSTTQKILTGILRGYSGEVRLSEKPLECQQKDFHEKIGVLFEFPYLYTNLSALDNLNYFASFYPTEQRRNIEELLELLEFKKDFLKKPVSSYSKGMRQRVSMARALLNNPKHQYGFIGYQQYRPIPSCIRSIVAISLRSCHGRGDRN